MDFSSNRILVRFNAKVPRKECLQIHQKIGSTIIDEIPELNIHIVSIGPEQNDTWLNEYSSYSEVLYAERDGILKAQFISNDPLFPQQWGLLKIKAPKAWDITKRLPAVRVAILDTGIDQSHPDITPKIVLNANFSVSPTFNDFFGHGTHIAGIVDAATNNGIGVAGLAINSTIMNIKVVGDNGKGLISDLARGIIFAAKNKAKVINMSLGGTDKSETLHRAVRYAAKKGVVLTAAAGNDGTSRKHYPAAFPECISVAATNQNDKRASFSDFGASWVDVAAPGYQILSTLPTHPNLLVAQNYGLHSGTSQAAAFVSGLAGLIMAVNPNLKGSNVRKIIESTTDRVPGFGILYRFGRINAFKAIKRAQRV